MGDTPNSYRDPYWVALADTTGEKLGLPPGLLPSIVTKGERSNHDQVSEAGAKTVFQIIPSTRDAALKKYGVDAYLSPENAAEVAGRLLKDSLDRNKGNPYAAVAEYHGGTDRGNWGAKTRAYVARVMDAKGTAPAAAPEGAPQSTFQHVLTQQQATPPNAIAAVYDAYKAGKMTPEESADFEADVKSGVVMLPRGATLAGQTPPASPTAAPEAMVLPKAVTDAYTSGKMTDQERAELEADMKAGLVKLPPTMASQVPTNDPNWKPPTEQGVLPAPAPGPSLVQQVKQIPANLLGSAEAGATLVTGATTGQLGQAIGAGNQIITNLLDGTIGTPEASKLVEEAGARGMQMGTHQPITQSGKAQAQVIGDALQQTVPFIPLGAELGAIGASAKAAAPVMQAHVVAPAVQAATRAGEAVQSVAGKVADRVTPAGRVNMGAAATSDATLARGTVANASPELQAHVEGLIKSGDEINHTALTNHAEAESLPVPVRLTRGQATEDPILISEERNARGKSPEYAERFNNQNQQLIDNVNALKEEVAPDVFHQNASEHGDALIGSYEHLNETLQNDIRAKYKALEDANGGHFPLDTQAFVTSAEAALAKANRTRFLPGEVRGLLDDYRNGAAMTFNDFESLRTILAEQSRKAERAGDGSTKYAIGLVRKALEDMPMTNETATLKPLADAARSAAKNRFDMIERDPALSAVVNGKALADNFINKHVVNADSGHVQIMLDHLSQDPLARQVIASGLINHLKAAAKVGGDTGNFAQNSFNGALTKLDPKLQMVLGGTAAKMKSLGNVARLIKSQPEGAFVNNSNTTVSSGVLNHAAGLAEGVANVVVPGARLGTAARNVVAKRQASKQVESSLKVGAGTSAKESKLMEVRRKVEAKKASIIR